MVLYFIGVYIINRTLHGRLETRNFSCRVEKIFHEWAQRTSEIFSTLEEKFRIFARSCNILYLFRYFQAFSVIFVKSFSNVGIIEERSLQEERFLKITLSRRYICREFQTWVPQKFMLNRQRHYPDGYTPNCKNVVIEKRKKGKSEIGIN